MEKKRPRAEGTGESGGTSSDEGVQEKASDGAGGKWVGSKKKKKKGKNRCQQVAQEFDAEDMQELGPSYKRAWGPLTLSNSSSEDEEDVGTSKKVWRSLE